MVRTQSYSDRHKDPADEHDESYYLSCIMNILDGWFPSVTAEEIYGAASDIVSSCKLGH